MDTIILYGKDDQVGQSVSLPAGSQDLIDNFIDTLLSHPDQAWVERFEVLSKGVRVEYRGFPAPWPNGE